MKLKRFMAAGARRLKHWLLDAEEAPHDTAVPFDNTSLWVGQSYRTLMQDPVACRRPAYVWGVLKGCALGKVLGYESVSVIEFGVAGGAGLVSMERVADASSSTQRRRPYDRYRFRRVGLDSNYCGASRASDQPADEASLRYLAWQAT